MTAKAGRRRLNVTAKAGRRRLNVTAKAGRRRLNVTAKAGRRRLNVTAKAGRRRLNVTAKAGRRRLNVTAKAGRRRLNVTAKAGRRRLNVTAKAGRRRLNVTAKAGRRRLNVTAKAGRRRLNVTAKAGRRRLNVTAKAGRRRLNVTAKAGRRRLNVTAKAGRRRLNVTAKAGRRRLNVTAKAGRRRLNVTAHVTRRRLLASAAAFGLLGSLRAKSRLGKSQVSATTDEIAATQSEALVSARMQGLQWVTLHRVPETKKEFAQLTAPELKAYAAELQANKLKVSVLKTTLGSKDAFSAAITAAQALGAGKIGIPIESAQTIDGLIPLAENGKVRLLIENQPARAVRAILDRSPSKWVGFSWDPLLDRTSLDPGWREVYALLPKTRMFNVQARSESLSDGPDQLNWRAIMEALQRDGFQGEICLETGQPDAAFEKASESLGNLLHIAGEVG